MNSIRKISNVTYAATEIWCLSFFWHWEILCSSSVSCCLNKKFVHRKGSLLKGERLYKMWIPESRFEVVLMSVDHSCTAKMNILANSFYRRKWKIFSSLMFYISLINSPLPCCHCLALMNLNKLTFSLADKYLSNPAKERQFSLTQLITSHLYVFCGWIILSQGWNNIPSHCKQLLGNPTLMLLFCVGFFFF